MRSVTFDEKLTESAIKIMDKLADCPCAKLLVFPFERGTSIGDFYYQAVDHPVSISSIKRKLSLGMYQNVLMWKKDIHLLFENTRLLASKSSHFTIVADYLEDKADKMMTDMLLFKPKFWSERVFLLIYKLQYMVLENPSVSKMSAIIGHLINGEPKYATDDLIPDKPCEPTHTPSIPKPSLPEPTSTTDDFSEEPEIGPGYTDNQIHQLLRAITSLTDARDIHEVGSLIMEHEPSLKVTWQNSLHVDVTALKPQTISELVSYTKRRYRELNLDFPKLL